MIKLGPEKAVYSVLLPEVKELLTKSISEFYIHVGDRDYLNQTRWDAVGEFKYWIKDIVDLSEFKCAYPTNGVTGAIDQWLIDNTTKVQTLIGEYGWVSEQRESTFDDTQIATSAYISNPFSATGNFHNNHKQLQLPTLLDCAFIGTTAKYRIELSSNIEQIAFSFGKGFGVNSFRTGFVFSKNKITALETLMNFNYYNLMSVSVGRILMKNFPVDYVYNKFRPTQLEICEQNNLTPSDCVFLATSTDSKYDHYKRRDGTNRICLSREYEHRGLGSFDLRI
jgi:hypothetical protein